MSAPLKLPRGRITRLNRGGIGYIATDDSRASAREFVFSFDQIRRGSGSSYAPYRGESLKELGFREGAQVAFSENEHGLIDSVEVDS